MIYNLSVDDVKSFTLCVCVKLFNLSQSTFFSTFTSVDIRIYFIHLTFGTYVQIHLNKSIHQCVCLHWKQWYERDIWKSMWVWCRCALIIRSWPRSLIKFQQKTFFYYYYYLWVTLVLYIGHCTFSRGKPKLSVLSSTSAEGAEQGSGIKVLLIRTFFLNMSSYISFSIIQ